MRRMALVGLLCFVANRAALAQTNVVEQPQRLPAVVVTGPQIVGALPDAATAGIVSHEEIEQRPFLRPAEVIETVPGVVVTQHSGSGKANQYFLRGFNLDHGTDLATTFAGVPMNLPTHAHGQGYTDLNFVIPELVGELFYIKGPYFAQEGDFASAGAVHLDYVDALPAGLAQIEGGSFGYARALFASSAKLGDGSLLYGIEAEHDDGPWTHPDDFQKFSGVARYSAGNWRLTLLGYQATWDSTDQIAQRAVRSGLIGRFDSLDPSDGGDSQRYGLVADWHGENTTALVYAMYYDLDLFSNFTYFLDDPVNGDQFEQMDKRWTVGTKVNHNWTGELFGRQMDTTVGLAVRNDIIENGLFRTVQRQRIGTTRSDDVLETGVGVYAENKTEWLEKFRTVLGLRTDVFYFDVVSNLPVNSGATVDALASPKLSLIFGPWAKTQVFLNGGLGYHSNDGRGVQTTVDPASGTPVKPADPLVQSYGAEMGVRTGTIPRLETSVAFWWLDIDSELVFLGDAGTTEPSRRSRRFGVEWSIDYNPLRWLRLDADVAWSQARFRDHDAAGNHIPGSIETVVSAGITVHDLGPWDASLRCRYFGPRPLIEDNSQRSSDSLLFNGRLGYRINQTWSVALEVLNILDTKADDIAYFYTSRLPGEPAAGVDDIHFHPIYPRTFRGALTARF
jgi:outer membrane cobalamin receptor